MGIGDDLIATGLAKGARDRGRRIAFGDGNRIRWGPHSPMVFKNNPNIAPPGTERWKDVEWIDYYKGHRKYNKQSTDRWIWNYDFKVKPGEIYFDADEDNWVSDPNLILIEPNVPNKTGAWNKQWPIDYWATLMAALLAEGYKVRQFEYGAPIHVTGMTLTRTFRHAAALLKSARLAVLPEGGLHHAAAAVGTPAVVLFGGFVPPDVLGYDSHINLTGGANACGSFARCPHCVEAMAAIRPENVLDAIDSLLRK